MKTVAVLVPPDVILTDLAVSVDMFSWVELPDGGKGYRVLICGPDRGGVRSRGLQLVTPHGLEALEEADLIVVPGSNDLETRFDEDTLGAIRKEHARGARLASVCVGAFLLADTGLLDGRRATTHWKVADQLAARHPAIFVDPTVIYIDNGDVLTSAGATAGIDLCLHIIAADHGAAAATEVGRIAVAPLKRESNEPQVIANDQPADVTSLLPLLRWLEENLDKDIRLRDMAAHAMVSQRTLSRRFVEQTGLSPVQWLARRRVFRAREMLETTTLTIDTIAGATGFASANQFRVSFQRSTGTSPTAYRRRFLDLGRRPAAPSS